MTDLQKSWTLRKIEQRASKIESIRSLMRDEMRLAHSQGASLREIAGAARVSYETVRGLIRQDQASGS